MGTPSGAADASPPTSKPSEGAAPLKKIGKYEIQKKIGAGGMGAVYLAVDSTLRRPCALKVLPKDKAKNPTLVKRFKAEAHAAANLRHENIVAVFEADEADGLSYIALEYVDGTDVARLVEQRGTIPLKRSIEIVRQVAKALEHAHQQGIVHRDIKPGNLLVRRDGVVKLADMGLARNLDDNADTSITRAGTTVGTVDYMSPEQARDSKAADVRSDIYSLGCTWYFMLTGHPPFPEGSLTNKLRAHAETPLPDPRTDHPAISEAVFGVIRRMTDKKPAKRYQTPTELLADLAADSLSGDIVSDTILEDLSEAPGNFAGPRRKVAAAADLSDESVDSSGKHRRGPAKTGGAVVADAPAFKPPPRKDRRDDDRAKPVRTNPAIFYAIVAVLLVGAVIGIIVLVANFGGQNTGPDQDRMGNPFANAQAVQAAAGHTSDGARTVGSGTSGGAADAGPNASGQTTIGSGGPGGESIGGSAATGQPARTTIGSGEAEGNVPTGYSGSNTSVVDSGPLTTRITSEGGVVRTETIGRGASGTGGGPGPNSTPSAARIKQEIAFVPDWANQRPAAEGVTKLIVRPGASGKDELATLNEALAQAPAAGAVIQLVGSGPFPLYAVKVSDKTRIVIEPHDQSDDANVPFIVLLPPEEGSASNFLEFSNTAVELRRVHLGLDASDFSTSPDDAMLSVVSGDVSLKNCSLSVKGTAIAPLTAVKIAGTPGQRDGKSGAASRVLVENTLLRGNSLTGLLIQTEHLDLAMRNSLIWSGGAPAVRFAAMARSDADSGRALRLVSTTICSRHCAVQMAGDAAQPVPTAFKLLNSLLAAPAGSAAPALFELQGWDQSRQKAAFGKLLTWETTGSLFTGWKTLVQFTPGPVASVTTGAQWQTAWKDKSPPDKEQVQVAPWPARPITDVATANLDSLAPQTLGKQLVKTSDGGWPGCQTAALVTVDLAVLETARVAAIRPDIPRGLFDFPVRDTLRIDLAKEDLGKVLERQKLQNGTHVIAAGSGPRQSSPIVIENAWVRLSFEQTSGPPLVLSPRAAESKHEAFITVVGGGLEIVNAALAAPTSERQPLPKWFIQVIDGDLAMWRCRIQGPMTGTTRNKGLIQWQRESGRPPARSFEGKYQGYLALVDCFLIGSGTTLEADLRHRALFLRNAIAVSRDDVLSLGMRGADSQIAGVVDIQYSTLSAVDRFIHVAGAELGAPTDSPLTFYSDRCVFAPPLRSGQQRIAPTLLSYSGQALEQKQVAWWENRCGYAADITSFLRADSEPAGGTPQNFEQAWVAHWGAEQVVEPLLGVKGVILKADLPTKPEDRSKLEPTDFELHASSRAFTWDGGNQPIGAYASNMKLPPLRAAASSPPKTKTPKAPATVTPAPGF
jgi:serine/threonine protein kinase